MLNGSQIQRSQAILGRDYSSALQDPFYQHFFYLYSKHFQFFETTLNRTKLDMAVLGKRSFWLPQDGLTRTWKHIFSFSESMLDQHYEMEPEGAVLLQILLLRQYIKARSALFLFVMACGSTCMNSAIEPAQVLS